MSVWVGMSNDEARNLLLYTSLTRWR